MTAYKITAEMNLKKIIDESREVAQAFNEFADNLEQIEKKYTKSQESEDEQMKAIIHYNGQYEDSVEIKGNTIEELKVLAYEEINKRGWEEEHCWSEVLDKEESNELENPFGDSRFGG